MDFIFVPKMAKLKHRFRDVNFGFLGGGVIKLKDIFTAYKAFLRVGCCPLTTPINHCISAWY